MNRTLAIVALLLVSMAVLTPLTVNADTPSFVQEGTDIGVQSAGGNAILKYTGYIKVNVSDTIYVNWTEGSTSATSYFGVYINTVYASPSWSNFLWRNYSVSLYSSSCYYVLNAGFLSQSSPINGYLVAPTTGIYQMTIYTWGVLSQQTFQVNVTRHQESSVNLTPLYSAIETLNQTVNNLNQMIQNIQSNTTTISSQITDILAQINVLKVRVTNNDLNITELQASIVNLQGQLDDLKVEVSNINASVTNNINVTNNITQMADLTAINRSIVDLTTALDDLNATVRAIDIPPDTQGNVTKLQAENAQSRKDLDALKKTPPGSNVTLYNNKTTYSNNTITKRVSEGMGTGAVSGLAIGAIAAGAIVGGIAGAVASRRKKDEPPELPQEPRAIPVAKAKPRETPKPPPEVQTSPVPPEPTPEKADDIDDILGQLEAPKTDKDMDAKLSDRLAKQVHIGDADYTESQIMSKLSSLPRGLPSEFFGIDPSELAAILMVQKYTINDEGDIIFQHGKKLYYGDPAKLGIYLQRASKKG